ncbi:MAG TPA: 4'-phosphopantetheinyl transferase superfamily protein [Longimicrobiales bacterium]|nr:4'-phosphopantetheinyl transferase superfamily protein [Longimicrobiales bacterium]
MSEEERASVCDVYLAWGMSSSVPRHDEWLTDAERAVHRNLTVPKRASDWRLGRWVGKEVVRRALHAPEMEGQNVEILASPTGAPTVTVHPLGRWPEVSLSLSHAWGMGFAAALVGAARIGCDVEALRPRSDAFVADYFTAREANLVREAAASDQAAWANLLWSAKEAALKVLGEGLRLDTRSVEVTVVDGPFVGGWRAFTVAIPGGDTLKGYWRVTSGFVWTLAVDGPVGRLEASPVG